MFDSREQAQDFFEEYINDVDVLDIRCKKGEEVVHIDYCTCGIIELDEEENPVLFYNKKNQIFLMETGPQVFLPPQELKNDVKNLNLTNRLIRKCKTLGREQRKRYIELGKYCEECQTKPDNSSDEEREQMKKLYPFFTFYFKTFEEKGHAKSMNIIRNHVLENTKSTIRSANSF
jgi:hypothetical protein